jgi:WD40 repeat protein/serine/threonine protein kinase
MNEPDAFPNRSEKEIFFEALDKHTPEERAAFLDGACGKDPARRARVEALLADHFQPDSFMKQPAVEGARPTIRVAPMIEEVAGTVIGRYKLLQQIGEGGCGVVYMAEQEEPVRRRVALKVIKLGMDTKQVIARFEAERQALALMDHPNIAKVLDAGASETGRPYFVMELVKGIPITRYCDEHHLSTVTRLGLFVLVCQAIQHAHQKGIIHRDIKPSNILVADHDGVPVPKIIDFGIAKATTDQRLTDKTLFTAFEQFIGTPAYMSPEQANLSGLDIDTRSDIYSLGVLLYELLTGKTPFAGTRMLDAGLDEIRRIIREEEPARPSTKLHTLDVAEQTAVAQQRQTDPPKLSHLIRGDLDWIVMKALEKDRGRRYETANGLAMDIQRHLKNEPVVARPPSGSYRFQRMIRRNKLVCTAAGAVAVALLAGLGLSTWAFLRERQAHANARRLLYGADMNLAQQAWDQSNLSLLDQLLEETKTFPDRGFEWYYWQRQTHLSLKTLRGHRSWVDAVAFSPDSRRIVTGSWDATAKLWDATGGQELLTLKGHTSTVTSVAFSRDGQRIVTGSYDGTAKVWDAASGRVLLTLKGHAGQVLSAAFSPDGRRIVTGGVDQTAKVWDAASGQELLTLKGHASWVGSAAFSPDGRRIVTGSYDSTAKVWDVAGGPALLTLQCHGAPIYSAAFSPDGRRIVIGSADHTATVWDANSGAQLLTLKGHTDNVLSAAFSRDGQRIVTGSRDRMVKVWDAASGFELLTLKEHKEDVSSVAFSPDGRRIVTGSSDGTAKLWDAATDREPITLSGHSGFILSVSYSPDGQRIVTGSADKTARVWDTASGRELLILPGHSNLVSAAVFSPDGQRIATGSDDHTAKVWDAASGRELLSLDEGSNWVHSVAFSPDGQRIVTGTAAGSTEVWDAASGRKLLLFNGSFNGLDNGTYYPQGFFCMAAYSPDGQRIVTGSLDGTAKVWQAASGKRLLIIHASNNGVSSVAFSPDSRRIATGSQDRTAKVWDAASGRELLTLKGHNDAVSSVAFSPDGQRIITGSQDRTAKLWDASSGRELLTLKGHEGGLVSSVAFSPDGLSVVTASWDQTAKVWQAARKEQVAQWQAAEAAPAQH